MSFSVGQKVYTVNAKDNTVDEWTYSGKLRTKDGLLIHLTRGKEYCFLPLRCVFSDRRKALYVARKYFFFFLN